jgi:hypothetical protein
LNVSVPEFMGFDLHHVPPQAVLVILVDTVREGVLQLPVDDDASTFISCTTTASSLRLSYGRKVTLPLEEDDVLELPMVDLLNLPAIQRTGSSWHPYSGRRVKLPWFSQFSQTYLSKQLRCLRAAQTPVPNHDLVINSVKIKIVYSKIKIVIWY